MCSKSKKRPLIFDMDYFGTGKEILIQQVITSGASSAKKLKR